MCKINGILTLLQGCNSMNKLHKIHAQILLNGYQNHPSISNKLLNFCAVSVSGSLSYARLLFNHIETPQTETYNSMIRGFSQSPSPLEAVFYYNKMVSEGEPRPDIFTFSFVLKACEKAKAKEKCRETHASLIRCGYAIDAVVCTNLMRSYAGNGSILEARKVFEEMPERDLVSWNSMIACYSQTGLHEEALGVYNQMENSNMGLDEFTVVSLLSSCAHVGALNLGVKLHKVVDENGFMKNVIVGNALIDMYAKCGILDGAHKVFNGMQRRDVFTWNSMIVGLGVNGLGNEAIALFEEMLAVRVRPNSITFLGLLLGCSHQGLVKEGSKYFKMMGTEFNLQPGVKHHGCMVDMLGRAGELDKALQVIRDSSSVDDPVLWRTLLGACKIHTNMEIGEIAMRNLVDLNALNAGDCVLLAGIYSDAKDKQGVSRMRKLIKTQGIKTTPGWSWIEIHGRVHKFVVDDKSHIDSQKIYDKLKEITHQAHLAGYVTEKSVTSMHDSCEECSGNSGSYHSEKLAIAFGLARTPDKMRLRIVKNLRVCRDCHFFTKFVSKAYGREIIVRDRVRFHHFKDGACSCKDYW